MKALPGPSVERWDELAAVTGNVFLTRAWAECWLAHYGSGCTPLVLTDTAPGGALRAILPLYVTGRLPRQVRFLGNGPADQLGPLCAPQERSAAAMCLLALQRERGLRWDLIVAQDVPETAGWRDRLGATMIGWLDSPVLHFGTDVWEEFLSERSGNFREQVRRRERKLRGSFDVRYRLATADSLTGDLAVLFRLHRERWGPRATFASGTEQRFHEDFAAVAMAQGRLRLWVLELDGLAVAALSGVRFAGAEYFHQLGRDPRFDRGSIGFVLLTHSIRTALEDGMREYRLLRGGEADNSRFADSNDGVYTLALARGLKGRAAITTAKLCRPA